MGAADIGATFHERLALPDGPAVLGTLCSGTQVWVAASSRPCCLAAFPSAGDAGGGAQHLREPVLRWFLPAQPVGVSQNAEQAEQGSFVVLLDDGTVWLCSLVPKQPARPNKRPKTHTDKSRTVPFAIESDAGARLSSKGAQMHGEGREIAHVHGDAKIVYSQRDRALIVSWDDIDGSGLCIASLPLNPEADGSVQCVTRTPLGGVGAVSSCAIFQRQTSSKSSNASRAPPGNPYGANQRHATLEPTFFAALFGHDAGDAVLLVAEAGSGRLAYVSLGGCFRLQRLSASFALDATVAHLLAFRVPATGVASALHASFGAGNDALMAMSSTGSAVAFFMGHEQRDVGGSGGKPGDLSGALRSCRLALPVGSPASSVCTIPFPCMQSAGDGDAERVESGNDVNSKSALVCACAHGVSIIPVVWATQSADRDRGGCGVRDGLAAHRGFLCSSSTYADLSSSSLSAGVPICLSLPGSIFHVHAAHMPALARHGASGSGATILGKGGSASASGRGADSGTCVILATSLTGTVVGLDATSVKASTTGNGSSACSVVGSAGESDRATLVERMKWSLEGISTAHLCLQALRAEAEHLQDVSVTLNLRLAHFRGRMRQNALLQSGRAAGRGSGEGRGCNRGESQAPKWLLTAQADLRQTDVMGGEVRGDHSVGWCSHSLMYDVKQLVPRDLMQFESNGRTGAGLNIIVRVRQAVSFASSLACASTAAGPRQSVKVLKVETVENASPSVGTSGLWVLFTNRAERERPIHGDGHRSDGVVTASSACDSSRVHVNLELQQDLCRWWPACCDLVADAFVLVGSGGTGGETAGSTGRQRTGGRTGVRETTAGEAKTDRLCLPVKDVLRLDAFSLSPSNGVGATGATHGCGEERRAAEVQSRVVGHSFLPFIPDQTAVSTAEVGLVRGSVFLRPGDQSWCQRHAMQSTSMPSEQRLGLLQDRANRSWSWKMNTPSGGLETGGTGWMPLLRHVLEASGVERDENSQRDGEASDAMDGKGGINGGLQSKLPMINQNQSTPSVISIQYAPSRNVLASGTGTRSGRSWKYISASGSGSHTGVPANGKERGRNRSIEGLGTCGEIRSAASMSRSETGAMAWARASLVRRVAEAAKATQKEGGICGRGGAATSVDGSSAAGAQETAVSSSGAQPAGADEERRVWLDAARTWREEVSKQMALLWPLRDRLQCLQHEKLGCLQGEPRAAERQNARNDYGFSVRAHNDSKELAEETLVMYGALRALTDISLSYPYALK